ncbi:GyrI-like domain-containing protein [bacterium]|nr:GyrI-like domain-containing protein [bacterium]
MADEKLNLYKHFRQDYTAKQDPAILRVTPSQYLMIDGHGAPGNDQFSEKMGALYGMAYTIKFGCKERGQDFVVCKLEGLWWIDGVEGYDFVGKSADDWSWRILIRMPDFVTQEDRQTAIETLHKKKKEGPFEDVRFEHFDEGEVVQILHVGPYAEETPTIMRMHAYAEEQGYKLDGLHHEIYLGDPRKTDPAKLKTILRHPVKKG